MKGKSSVAFAFPLAFSEPDNRRPGDLIPARAGKGCRRADDHAVPYPTLKAMRGEQNFVSWRG